MSARGAYDSRAVADTDVTIGLIHADPRMQAASRAFEHKEKGGNGGTMESTAAYASLTKLCAALTEATAAGHIEWVASEDASFSYESEKGAGAVEIRSCDQDGEAPFELAIYNAEMVKVDSLLSDWSDEEPAPWNAHLFDLYRVARRQALGVDQVIDGLLAEVHMARDDAFADR
jgi:hypothetical protein